MLAVKETLSGVNDYRTIYEINIDKTQRSHRPSDTEKGYSNFSKAF